MLQIFENASKNLDRVAIIDEHRGFTYRDLLDKSAHLATILLDKNTDLNQKRVAFMINPGVNWVICQWAIWRAGGVAVPISISYPPPSIEYLLEDTGSEIVITEPEFEEILKGMQKQYGFKLYNMAEISIAEIAISKLPEIEIARNAMILYTSGTTNKPKGVVTTHYNIESQISTLIDAWHWSSEDQIVNVLPLHHVHGIINVVSSCLWAGGTLHFLPNFDAEKLIKLLTAGQITLFMAVPTIYFKLIAYIESLGESQQKEIKEKLLKLRLMISGSAALPVSVLEKWQKVSGHFLLERYGMTEIGMGISNPYDGERRAGYIGVPLPKVEVRLINEGKLAINEPGEIQVKGPNVFKEYWNKAEATASSFTEDGWFKTGDVAIVENGYYRILGRDSVDIIKSGGYKISALEIEEVLRKYPEISDCCVVGIADEEWGEVVSAAIITDNSEIDLTKLNQWMRENMPAYKTPRKYLIVNELLRNAMGKVTKNDVKKLFT